MNLDLEKLKGEMEEIAGQWNGEYPGILEDRADTALEILEAIRTIEENLEYLDELDGHISTLVIGNK